MIFEHANRTFYRIASVDMWWGKLAFDIIFCQFNLSSVEATLSMTHMFGCDPECARL